MAIQKYVAISYCFAFLFVYLISIAYATISTSINEISDKALLPQTQTMNATSMAISSVSDWSGTLIIAGIISLIFGISFIILSLKSMSVAI